MSLVPFHLYTAITESSPTLCGRYLSIAAELPHRRELRRGRWRFVIYGDEPPYLATVTFGGRDNVVSSRHGFKTARKAAKWLERWVVRNAGVLGRTVDR